MEIALRWVILLIVAIVAVGIMAVVAVVCSKKDSESITGEGSYFDGNTFQLIGYRILSGLISTITLGIAYPWMLCMVKGWEVKHTVIHGRRLKFTGHGHQLIGKYLLWGFLTVITLGIYSIWLGLGMKKWVVKHTVYADEKQPVESWFSGGAGGYLGIHLLSFLLSVFTLGIGRAWAKRTVLSWEMKHTHIGGSPLEFNGTGGQLFGKYLLLVLLTPLTLGIYALFFTVIYLKWQAGHTEAVYQTAEIQAKARAHEATALQNFARYRIAANDQELAALKSGFTGCEDAAVLESLAAQNNPFALYRLAKQEKGDKALYEGKALLLLQRAVGGNCHPAMLDLAKQASTEQKIALLTEAARCGNAEASRLLALEYQKSGDLVHGAYWYKVALEWGVPGTSDEEYESLIKALALQYAEDRPAPRQSPALAIVLSIVAVFAVFGIVAASLMMRSTEDVSHAHSAVENENWNIQEVHLIHGKPVEQLRGEERDSMDHLGNELHYIYDRNMFFDYEHKMLYFEFGVVEYDYLIWLSTKEKWKTEPITGSGVFMVSYPYDAAPEYVSVCGETFVSGDDTVNITSGTAAEAELWLQERIRGEEPTAEEPGTEELSTEAPNLAELLLGNWVCYEYSSYEANSFLTELGWGFQADGRGSFYDASYEYYGTADGDPNVYYIDGDYWYVTGGGGQNGSYYLEGDVLIFTTDPSVQYGESTSYTYQIISLTEDSLELLHLESGMSQIYTRAG